MPRPRKSTARRQPDGRVKPSKDDVIAYARIRTKMYADVRGEEYGCPFSMLWATKKIDDKQYAIGKAFRDAREAADRALGLPSRHARGQDLSAVHGLSNANDDEASVKRKQRAIAAYDAAEAAVGCGSRELAVLQAVVIYDMRPDTHEDYLALVRALDRLTAAWQRRA